MKSGVSSTPDIFIKYVSNSSLTPSGLIIRNKPSGNLQKISCLTSLSLT